MGHIIHRSNKNASYIGYIAVYKVDTTNKNYTNLFKESFQIKKQFCPIQEGLLKD